MKTSKCDILAVENRFLDQEQSGTSVSPPDQDVLEIHRAIPGYAPTPLHSLSGLAERLGIGNILVKDESQRFGLNAFKALGASYGMYRVLKQRSKTTLSPRELFAGTHLMSDDPLTFAAATEGNHGRAVAWAARKLGMKAVIFAPADASQSRLDNIRAQGAEVRLVQGTYDDAVNQAAKESAAQGWQVIADFGYDGYLEIPPWIESGYSTMFIEIAGQLQDKGWSFPGLVMLQVGGGCFAAGAIRAIRHLWKTQPRFACVEPVEAACMFASAQSQSGELMQATGKLDTICAGLNVPTPSLTSWPTLRSEVDVFLAIEDEWVKDAMRHLYHPVGSDAKIISGESGAAGLAGLIALQSADQLDTMRETLGLDADTTVLVINTEGDTDPEFFRHIVGEA